MIKLSLILLLPQKHNGEKVCAIPQLENFKFLTMIMWKWDQEIIINY
jgi:hypothetical protein